MPIYVDCMLVNSFIFPGGESHLKFNEWSDEYNICAYLYKATDIIELLLLVDAIRRINFDAKIFIEIPYFPYARQDRVYKEGEPLSIKVITDLINSLKCQKVTLYDPHSDVTQALLRNCNVVTAAAIIAGKSLGSFMVQNNLIVVAPDIGATKRILEVKKIYKSLQIIQATKIRDSYGAITESKIYEDVQDQNLIIIDDICDGGATFINLAALLKDKGANKLYLYVTHGIFSKGLSVLQPYFEHIYCYHTMLPEEEQIPSFLTILRNYP